MTKLTDVEGIGPTYAAKLTAAGCRSQEHLLEIGGTKAGRKKIAADSGCTEKQILEWVNRADLCRIKGVGSEYSDLLECSGVDTVLLEFMFGAMKQLRRFEHRFGRNTAGV